MAKMVIGGVTYSMSVAMKSRLLEVIETEDAGVLNVESGTERGKFYPVRHDGHVALSCPCKAIGDCAHKQAAERYLASVEVLGKQFAEDLPAHVEDDLRGQDPEPEPEQGQFEQQAWAIIDAEYAERERKAQEPAVLRDGEGLYYVLTGDTYRVMSAHDLAQIGPYREGDEQDRERLAVMLSQPVQDERERKMAANQAYRDAYPGDYGYCDAA